MTACVNYNVKKVVIPLTSCGYPVTDAPLKESQYEEGKPHPSVAAHANCKRGILQYGRYLNQQFGNRFVFVIFNNLFGDNARWECSDRMKVADSLIKRFTDCIYNHDDKIEIWGSGNVYRELMYADNAAEACLWALQNYDDYEEPINIGHGADISIRELAEIIKEKSGFEGKLVFDTSKPDGAKSKLLDVSKMRKCGFEPKINVHQGIERTIEAYKEYEYKYEYLD
jgi:GDP-L-fucose synthase